MSQSHKYQSRLLVDLSQLQCLCVKHMKSYFHRTQWPTPHRTSGMVLISWLLSEQSLCTLACRVTVCRLLRLAGGLPRRSRRKAVATRAWSLHRLSMALHIVGWAWPTSFMKTLFHPSQMLLVLEPPARVMSWTFQMEGSYVGGIRRTRIGGTDPSGHGGGCMRRYPPDTYVESK